MQEHQHNKNIDHDVEKEIDIKEIIYIFLSKWYWFAISVSIFCIIGYIYLQRQVPVYETNMAVLVKQEQNAPEEMLLLQDLGMNMGKNNIDNEIGVFKSPDLVAKIVSSLELYTSYHRESRFGFYHPELYKKSPIYVRWENIEPSKIPTTVNFVFFQKNKGFKVEAEYTINGVSKSETHKIDSLPGFINMTLGKFYVAKQDSIPFGDQPILVEIKNAAEVARDIILNLSISPSTKQSSLLNLTLKSEDRKKGEDIMQAIVEEYNKDAIADKNMVAYNTAIFIEERLKDIQKELGDVESDVESFRKDNQVTDIPTQVGAYLSRNEGYEKRRMEVETQLNLIVFIETFINKSENRNKLIPNLGVSDPGLVSIIQNYNNLLINRERIESSTSIDNPSYKQINQQVESMHQNIKASLANERRGSEIALRDLDREYTATNSKIRNIPAIERQFTVILRQQEVKSNLFVFLLQKREETNLTQAGVAPKGKMIAKPFSSVNPIAPKSSIILLVFFIIGLAVPAIIIFLRDFFQTKVEGMRDLMKLRGINVIGDIEKVEMPKGKSAVVVKRDDDSQVTEMFRTLRNNMLFMVGEEDKNVILVTSTIPKEGKTFITANLSMSLSLMDKRVLVIGGDLRNPQIFSSLGYTKWEKGLSTYLAGMESDYQSLIHEVDNNLFVMPAGPIPPNPNELLSKERMGELVTILKKEYDYVVIDSAPLGVVTDTLLIAKYADATIYVVRENYSDKDTILFINNLVADKRIKNGAIVLNQASHSGAVGRYRYGYKYSYSYRYRYGYAQGYSKKEGNE